MIITYSNSASLQFLEFINVQLMTFYEYDNSFVMKYL